MPRWGISQSEYFFDHETNVIAKGVSSIKFMSEKLASQMYELSQRKHYTYFMDLLTDLFLHTCIDTRQLDMLIKIDFFSAFGNQRELLRLTDFYLNLYKKGAVKQIRRSSVEGSPLEEIVQKYAVGVTKSGGVAKSYTILDVCSIMRETEDAVMAIHMEDLPILLKVKNFEDVMGYAGYVSGRPEDKRKLYITDIHEAKDKNGKRYGYLVKTKNIGTGKESKLVIKNPAFAKSPVDKGDIILVRSYVTSGSGFVYITQYDRLV